MPGIHGGLTYMKVIESLYFNAIIMRSFLTVPQARSSQTTLVHVIQRRMQSSVSVVVVVKPINHIIHCLTACIKAHPYNRPTFEDTHRLYGRIAQQFAFLLIELRMLFQLVCSEILTAAAIRVEDRSMLWLSSEPSSS